MSSRAEQGDSGDRRRFNLRRRKRGRSPPDCFLNRPSGRSPSVALEGKRQQHADEPLREGARAREVQGEMAGEAMVCDGEQRELEDVVLAAIRRVVRSESLRDTSASGPRKGASRWAGSGSDAAEGFGEAQAAARALEEAGGEIDW